MSLPPGMELDKYVFDYVMGYTPEDLQGISMLPEFSHSLAACQMLIIKMMAENPDCGMTILWGEQYFELARRARFVLTEKSMPVWYVRMGDSIYAFGRTLPEALCKLSILVEMSHVDPRS